jgi:hypothetical protein
MLAVAHAPLRGAPRAKATASKGELLRTAGETFDVLLTSDRSLPARRSTQARACPFLRGRRPSPTGRQRIFLSARSRKSRARVPPTTQRLGRAGVLRVVRGRDCHVGRKRCRSQVCDSEPTWRWPRGARPRFAGEGRRRPRVIRRGGQLIFNREPPERSASRSTSPA